MENCSCGKKRLGNIRQICKTCGLPLPPLNRRDIQRMRQYMAESIKAPDDMTKKMDAFKDLIDEVGFEILEEAVKDYRKHLDSMKG